MELCADLVDEGTGWKLPTSRELVLMKTLEREIKQHNLNEFTNLYGDLWSASEASPGSASSVGFSDSNDLELKIGIGKGAKLKMRCIREIVEP